MGLLEIARDFAVANWDNAIMWVIGGILIYLAIKKDMEPTLLLPMGFGAILVNLPNSGAAGGIASSFAMSFLVFDETGSTLAAALLPPVVWNAARSRCPTRLKSSA